MCLKDIFLNLKAGNIYAIVGPVGSGKTSLLHTILGELPKSKGDIMIQGQVSYVNQIPWIFPGSIRDNILFGNEFDPVWYQRVAEACCLTVDFQRLPYLDLTLVGDHGITLSGGQKARVNLARAVYQRDSSIYLMDDPLSAVDGAVGSHIFRKCVLELMRDKIRILVTHQLHLLKDVDQIIVVKEGEVTDQGTFEELQADGVDFDSLIATQTTNLQSGSSSVKTDGAYNSLTEMKFDSKETESKEMRRQISENKETREKGHVAWRVYIEYFLVGAKIYLLLIFVFILIASHILYVLNDWWLSQWSLEWEAFRSSSRIDNGTLRTTIADSSSFTTTEGISGSGPQNNSTEGFIPMTFASSLFSYSPHPPVSTGKNTFQTWYYMNTYAVISGALLIVMLIRTILHFYICVTSGVHMHRKMFTAVIGTSLRFFDTNSSGRILNRFAKDIGQIDEMLPQVSLDFLFLMGNAFSAIILACIFNYIVLIIVIPLFFCCIWIRRYYIRTSRDIKRMEGTTRSPVFDLLSSTLRGLPTIRALRKQSFLIDSFHEKQDLHGASWFLFLSGVRWFGLRMDFLTSIFIIILAILSVVGSSVINLDAGTVALILTYSASLVDLFQWGVRQSAEVENLMTSVERVQEYYRLPPEEEDGKVIKVPNSNWPTRGCIKFKTVSLSYYKNGPEILRNLDFTFNSNEKIGIVGRTGAGKSSIVTALLGFSKLKSGKIYIDDVDLSSISLKKIRSAITVIPQDPAILSGTIRWNLDPLSSHTDDELWKVLEQVQLNEKVKSFPFHLDNKLSDSGSNLSVGQLQLFSLARAILRRTKVVVMDEATANIDFRTECFIQRIMRNAFKDCTVITIAHRVKTIIDSDRILVLDDGIVKEFGSPNELLKNPRGYFSKIVHHAGLEVTGESISGNGECDP